MSSIAVLLPCYNEAVTIQSVIKQFQQSLPEAAIYVFDNNSSDNSAALAQAAGAIVRTVHLQGKGNVVRRMFADIHADCYIMADADCTYDAARVRELITPILAGSVDTVIAARDGSQSAFPKGHRLGNALFNTIIRMLFGHGMRDIFSGYRSFSYRFAKSFPAHSHGFDIETELSIFILEQRIPFIEVNLPYCERPEGSRSKLHTCRDGLKISLTVLRLFKEVRPLAFFSCIALTFFAGSLVLGIPVIAQWQADGKVIAVAKAVLAMGCALLAMLSWLGGMILDSVARTAREARHLRYLNVTHR